MKRQTYLTYNLGNLKAKRIDTNEIISNELKLYSYTADENNLYYDYPQIDYPDNYVIIYSDGKEINFRDVLRKNNMYCQKHVIISNHFTLAGVEWFRVDPCNKFYSIYITDEVADFLETTGLNNFFVAETFFKYKLLELALYYSTGNEILFFIDSADYDIRKKLNEMRMKYLKSRILYKMEEEISKGIVTILLGDVRHFTFTKEDEENIIKFIKKENTEFINNNFIYSCTKDEAQRIYNKLTYNKRINKAYSNALINYIKTIITDGVQLSDITKNEFFCYYGYTNSCILKDVTQDEILY